MLWICHARFALIATLIATLLAAGTVAAQADAWATEWSERLGVTLLEEFDTSGPDAWDREAHPLVFIATEGPGFGDVDSGRLLIIDAHTLLLHRVLSTPKNAHHAKAFTHADVRKLVLAYAFREGGFYVFDPAQDNRIVGGIVNDDLGDHGVVHPDPDLDQLWVTCNGSFEVIVIDMFEERVIDRLPLPNGGSTHSGAFVDDAAGGVLSDLNGLHGPALEAKREILGLR